MNPEWPSYTVAELEKSGLVQVEDGNHGEYRPRSSEFGYGDTRFIRAADLDGGRVLFDSAERISDTAVNRIRKGVGAGGDVLFSHKGTVGKLALVEMDAPPFVCSPQTTFWRALRPRELDRHFLYYFMLSSSFRRQWDSRKGETDMADYVSLTAQRALRIQVPDISEQLAISRLLGALDAKSTLNREINRNLEVLARSIFKSWFVDFDPVVAKAEGRKPFGMSDELAALFPDQFIESEIGPIPEKWLVSCIGDLADYVNGKNFTAGASGTGQLVIRIAELNSGPGPSTVYTTTDADSVHTAFPDDILFAWSGSLGVFRWHGPNAFINQHIFKVICRNYPKWFVYFQLEEAMPFFRLVAESKATTMGHIKRSHLREAKLALPPVPLLQAATRNLEPLYESCHHHEIESHTLAELRDLLLPKLLSGEIRIRDAEKAMEAAG